MMSDFNLSYREVIPDQTIPESWKEISLNTGGTQSTLQDIKIAEKANGYCYRDASKHHSRNRFIYWRINNDILELVEQSLDVNLSGNKIRFKFIDTPILDGITIHETYSNVIILVPTVCSVHRLIFSHPDRLHKQDELMDSHPDISIPSIFSEASSGSSRENSSFYVYIGPSTANSQLPHSAASWLTFEEEAIFLLAYPSSELILVKQRSNGSGETIELKYETIMPKFLSGMFGSKNNDSNVVISMLLHTIGIETYAITLCRDAQLRIWSCTKAQCISVSDILSKSMDERSLIQGVQNHVLRKIVGADESDFIFAVFLSFSDHPCFYNILKPIITGTQFSINKVCSFSSPDGDLVDFSLTTNRIWSVWRNKDGECNVYSSTLFTDNSTSSRWVPVILESLPNPDEVVQIDESIDPRQTYLQYIFHPGRFPLQIISKALSIYKRSAILSEVNLSAPVLKQRVCMAVENEIQENTQDKICDESDEEYLEIANRCWSQFYSCCVQYHVAGLKPLGLLLLPSVAGVVVLKKSAYSFLRPLDVLEHLVLCSESVNGETLYGHPQLSDIKEECNDLIVLTRVLVFIDEQLNDIFKMALEKYLSQSLAPEEVVSELLSEVNIDEKFYEIKDALGQCSDLYNAMHKILELLRMDQPIPETNMLSPEIRTSINHLFSSHLGISVVSQCFAQQITTKFAICCNLLVLQNILIDEDKNDPVIEPIHSVCMPEVIVLLQSYYALFWLSELTANPILPLESQNQRLSTLKLTPVFNLKTNSQKIISLIELFIGSTGGFEGHKALLKINFDEDSLALWHTALLPYLQQITLIIWPINGNTTFTEWLLSSGQHVHLQQYVQLIHCWCDWNKITRTFLLAVVFLNSGETIKAFDLFVKASKGIYTEQFIMDRVGNADGAKAFILYYLKVIQLFELHGAIDYAIEAANYALVAVLEEDEPLKATLYSIKFKHHLALNHFKDAYEALDSNPDAERKKDNLRDLVKTLLDTKHLDILMSFNYAGMENLFFSILFTRARATDSVDNIYYDFLYSYCIKKSFMRLAASCMYEQAYRLSEYNTMDALEKQIKCYLASANCLCLTEDEKFSWVLKPSDPDTEVIAVTLPKPAGTNEKPQKISFKSEVEVIDVAGIRKELVFGKARLQLGRFDSNSLPSHQTSPHELVMYLSSAGMFKTAMLVCTEFNIAYDIPFEILTTQCIILSQVETNEAWKWLIENDLHDLEFIGNSPSAVAWTLLKTYLYEYEENCFARYHRVVCEKIIDLGSYVPQWLLDSYKKRNAKELLCLFMSSGYLDEAFNLSVEYLLAALGHGPERFGLSSGLTSVSSPLCLPVHLIDALIYELQLQNEKCLEVPPFLKEHGELKDLFLKYLDTAHRISLEVCREKMRGTL